MKTFRFSVMFLILVVILWTISEGSAYANARENGENASRNTIENTTTNVNTVENLAVENGLNYFRKRLDAGIMPGDGAFKNDSAITALVGMAFLSSGSTPTEGPDAQYVRRCMTLILENVRSNGVLASSNATEQGAIYAHGFAVTFLAECLGMSSEDERLRVVLEKAVTRIVQAQGKNGGWRYGFQPDEEDVSVTACLLTALRACRNAGIPVPATTIKNGIKYLLHCQNPDGGFRYRLVAGPSAYPRTAAAVAGLCAAGTYNRPEIHQALKYMKTATPSEANSETDGYYFYAQYYAVQAFRLTATETETQTDAKTKIKPETKVKTETKAETEMEADAIQTIISELIRLQKPDGSWRSALSTDYATAMALIVLQVETNYLPILQK
ncbi:MAG: terpene cyclase/mutase family protein [Planctomycetia bacterium]|nr:terpene cyclase/mutase family protein [Planctomycetia bacterium]